MEVSIKKVGENQGADRFILVDARTRKVLTAGDVNDAAIRRFFARLGADADLIDECLERARKRYLERSESEEAVLEPADEDDLLFELGLDESDD